MSGAGGRLVTKLPPRGGSAVLDPPDCGAGLLDTRNPMVLLVDDDEQFLRMVRSALEAAGPEWRLSLHNNPDAAWSYLQENRVDAVIADLTMPVMSGFDLLRRIRSNAATQDIPVTILTGIADGDLKHDALDLGAVDLLAKPFHAAELLARLRSMLRLRSDRVAEQCRRRNLEELVHTRESDLHESRRQVIWKLAKAAELRDEQTGEHVIRVARTSARIARQLGLSESTIETIELAAPLHDIGKIGIPDAILLKPGKLTPDEQATMRRHCEIGFRILSESGRLDEVQSVSPEMSQAFAPDAVMTAAQQIALSHHEHWDGSGYPLGLSGEGIPLAARIVAVADVYDALRSSRPYKASLSPAESLQMIERGRGRQFDPRIVDAFIRCQSALPPDQR